VFARFSHFRDAAGIPDRWFELTDRITPQRRVTSATVDDGRLDLAGEAYLKTRRPGRSRHRCSPTGRFRVADGHPVEPGWWDLVLSIGTDAVRRTVPVRADGLAERIDRDMAVAGSPAAGLAVGAGGRLRLRAEPVPGHVRLLARADRLFRRLRRHR
jgi:hypothetical protein